MFVFLLSEILALEFGPLPVQTHGFVHSRQDAQILANLFAIRWKTSVAKSGPVRIPFLLRIQNPIIL